MTRPRRHHLKAIVLMAKRHADGENVFTGEPLTGKDLKDWKLLNRQREYSLVPIEGSVE